MQLDKSNNENLHHVDAVFFNPGFPELAEAFKLQKNNQKVVLVFDNLPHDEDRFIISGTFPFSFYEMKRKLSEHQKWQKLISLAPHLFRHQKVIYQSGSGKNTISASLADRLFQNRYHEKLVVLTSQSLGTIHSLKPEIAGNSILFHEYRFNLSRYLIGLLRVFKKTGGHVFVDSNVTINKNTIILSEGSKEVSFREFKWAKESLHKIFVFDLTLPRHFVLVYKNKNHTIRFLSKNNHLNIEQTNDLTREIPQQMLIEYAGRVFFLPEQQPRVVEQQPIPPVEVLADVAEYVELPFPGTFPGSTLNDQFELCQEQYDQAKQAGITWNHFQDLFHRYGRNVEEITETAYSLMHENMDAEDIWRKAELNFQRKYEWRYEHIGPGQV